MQPQNGLMENYDSNSPTTMNKTNRVKSPAPDSKRTLRRAKRNFKGTRAQRRNERRQNWGGVSCSGAGTQPTSLSFEGTNITGRTLQYKSGSNNYHA